MSKQNKDYSQPLDGEILPSSSKGTEKESLNDMNDLDYQLFPCDISGAVNMAISPRALIIMLRSLGLRSVNLEARVTRIAGLRVVSIVMRCETLGATETCLSDLYQTALRAMLPATQRKK